MARRLSLFLFLSLVATCTTGSLAHASSIAITSGPNDGGVYTTAGLPVPLQYTVTGDTAVPSGTPQCSVSIAGGSSQTAACNAAPFSHSGTAFAPGKQSNWTGTSYGLPTGTEGQWTFTVSQTVDGTPLTASRTWAIDNTDPTISLASVQSLTNNPTPSLPFTIVDAHPGQSQCGINQSSSNAPSYVPCASPYMPAGALADGNYYFWVYHTDAAHDQDGGFGNTGFSRKAFTVDTAPPTLTIQPYQSPTSSTTPTVSFTYSGDNGASPTCRYYATGGTPGVYSDCTTYSDFYFPQLTEGSWTVDVKVVDAAGNSTTKSAVVVVDTEPPDVTIQSPSEGQVLASTTPHAQVTATDSVTGVAVLLCAYDSSDWIACDDAGFLATSLPVGEHNLHVRAVDGFGNAIETGVGFSIKLPDPPSSDPGGGSTPPAQAVVASRATFKRASAKLKKRRYSPVVKVELALPLGTDASAACKGSAKLTLTVKRGKTKSVYSRKLTLVVASGACTGSATFTLPASLRGRKAATRLTFAGSSLLAKFDLKGKISKL